MAKNSKSQSTTWMEGRENEEWRGCRVSYYATSSFDDNESKLVFIVWVDVTERNASHLQWKSPKPFWKIGSLCQLWIWSSTAGKLLVSSDAACRFQLSHANTPKEVWLVGESKNNHANPSLNHNWFREASTWGLFNEELVNDQIRLLIALAKDITPKSFLRKVTFLSQPFMFQ